MNEQANSDQLESPISIWWRKATAILSLSVVIIVSGVLFAAAIGVLTLLLLFVVESALT